METTHKIVLKGIGTAFEEQQVLQNLATLFKSDPEKIKLILTRSNYVVKKGLSLELATRYQKAIEEAGAVCTVELESAPEPLAFDLTTLPQEASTVNTSASNIDAEQPPTNPQPESSSAPTKIASSNDTIDIMTTIVDSLESLRDKVSKNHAYLGVLVGFSIFTFALFLSWSSIPAGMMARDGGTSSGWNEKGYLAIFPLVLALYPVFLQRAVILKNLLINIIIAFALLGYNNVMNRSMWQNYYNNLGSDMGAGFWIGLMSMIALSVFGIAWSLHTSENEATKVLSTDQ